MIKPLAIVLIEAESGPTSSGARATSTSPLFIVNARLSERSFPRYKRFGFLFRKLFASFAGVGAQNETDAARLCEIGCRPEAIHVVGSLKFDAAKLQEKRALNVPGLAAPVGVPADAPLLLGGSTHAGEEGFWLTFFCGCACASRTCFSSSCRATSSAAARWAANWRRAACALPIAANSRRTPGTRTANWIACSSTPPAELRYFYEHAHRDFRRQKPHGGRRAETPSNRARWARRSCSGPNMQKLRGTWRKTSSRRKPPCRWRDAKELESAVGETAGRRPAPLAARANALNVVRENLGAIERTVDMIVEQLDPKEFYVSRQGSKGEARRILQPAFMSVRTNSNSHRLRRPGTSIASILPGVKSISDERIASATSETHGQTSNIKISPKLA